MNTAKTTLLYKISVPSGREPFIFYSKLANVRVPITLTGKKVKTEPINFVEFNQYASGLAVFNLEKS
ncbi:hypothetical protein [Erwinia typographi]|uniref:hypothetical protein n=1 Tax=Erwinia typographi TaxID=371042 RepID=UPI0012ED2798|nr:hypothetical protein [Erwinia typographi]